MGGALVAHPLLYRRGQQGATARLTIVRDGRRPGLSSCRALSCGIAMAHIRAALRALGASPAFSTIAILTMAIGIGATAALFSVYDRLILHPVTIPQPASLTALWVNNPALNFNAPAMSWPRYEAIRAQARSFASIGISAFDNFTLTGDGEPEQLNGQR